MSKNHRSHGRREEGRTAAMRKAKPPARSGRDILRQEEHFRIAPKHPGMGRR
jgi:hypothetical protein